MRTKILELPPLEKLKLRFEYDHVTGILYKKFKNKKKVCGSLDKKSKYLRIGYMGKVYLAHRVAYALYHNIQLPTDVEIDHDNKNRSDNKIENLRVAGISEQNQNRSKFKNNTSGITGVVFEKRYNCWVARIQVGKKQKYIGSFKNLEDAKKARLEAEKLYHGEYAHSKGSK